MQKKHVNPQNLNRELFKFYRRNYAMSYRRCLQYARADREMLPKRADGWLIAAGRALERASLFTPQNFGN